MLSTLLELAGVAGLVAAADTVSRGLSYLVAGLAAIAVAYALDGARTYTVDEAAGTVRPARRLLSVLARLAQRRRRDDDE